MMYADIDVYVAVVSIYARFELLREICLSIGVLPFIPAKQA